MLTGWARDTLARTFSSLKVRNYRYYFAGQSISMIGTWMQSVTQSWLAYTLTRSGFDVGLVVALQALPVLLLGPVGGTLADRFGKYRMLFWTQGMAGVQALALAVLDLSGHLELWELYLLACSLGFIKMIDNPTRQSFIIEMVGRDQVRNAVTLNTISNNTARAIGPAVAGLLIAAVGSGWCFLINACSFVCVLGGLAAIRQEELSPAERATRLRGQLSEGFRYVAGQPVLRDSLLLMAVVGCLTYEFQTTLPLMAGDAFGGNSATYGFLTAFMGLGAVLGGLVAAGRRQRGMRALYAVTVAFGVVVLLAALAPSELAEELVLVGVGAGSVTFSSLTNSTLQLASEPRMRGRVMSLWSVAFQGTTPIGGPLVGFIAGEFGARYGLGTGAVAAIAAGALGLASYRRRRQAQGRRHPAPGELTVPGPGPREPAATGPARLVPGAPAPVRRELAAGGKLELAAAGQPGTGVPGTEGRGAVSAVAGADPRP
jgi:MFS family permease